MRLKSGWFIALFLMLFIGIWTSDSVPAQEPEVVTEEEIVGDSKSGEKLVETLDCRQCHTIQGDGGKVGPDLTHVGLRRSKDWLVRWLEDPTLFRPSSGMPGFTWKSEQEIYDIIAYLNTLKQPVEREKILKEKNRIKAGKKLVQAYDCRACHKIVDGGIDIYPDLTHAGKKLKQEWDKAFLKNPESWNKYTFMPNFNLSDPEVEAIVAYILSEKK